MPDRYAMPALLVVRCKPTINRKEKATVARWLHSPPSHVLHCRMPSNHPPGVVGPTRSPLRSQIGRNCKCPGNFRIKKKSKARRENKSYIGNGNISNLEMLTLNVSLGKEDTKAW
eukprot:1156359-Pelagomonas_calceolata.AAC.7